MNLRIQTWGEARAFARTQVLLGVHRTDMLFRWRQCKRCPAQRARRLGRSLWCRRRQVHSSARRVQCKTPWSDHRQAM